MTDLSNERLSEIVRLIADTPHPETRFGAHLTKSIRAQIAYAFIDNLKRKVAAFLAVFTLQSKEAGEP